MLNEKRITSLPLIPSHANITWQNWIITGGEIDGFIPPFLPIWNFSEVHASIKTKEDKFDTTHIYLLDLFCCHPTLWSLQRSENSG